MGPLSFFSGRSRRRFPSLERLVKHRKFDDIVEVLQMTDNVSLSAWLGVTSSSNVDLLPCNSKEDDWTWMEPTSPSSSFSALHMVVQSHPTVEVVDYLVQKMTEIKIGYLPEAAVDEFGRTALHIAVESGCDLTVVRRLTACSEVAVWTRDSDGRYPLHYAVIACGNTRRSGRQVKGNAIAVVNYLVEIYPRAVVVPDSRGKTPLDLAVDKHTIVSLNLIKQVLKGQKNSRIGFERTCSTAEHSNYPIVVDRSLFNDHDGHDDMSSVGSRGVSGHRRRVAI